MSEEQDDKPPTFAVVELLGHVKLAGKLSQEERFGTVLGRLDIWTEDGFATQYFGGGAVYRITVVTEAVARQVARSASPAPISPWDYPKMLTGPEMANVQERNEARDGGEQDDDDFSDSDMENDYDDA